MEVKKEDWILYADSVRDHNPLHREDSFAQQKGLEASIAPGMWVASKFLERANPQNLDLSFRSPVYDGEMLQISKNYEITKKGGTLVCQARIEEPKKMQNDLPPMIFNYRTEIAPTDLTNYLASIQEHSEEIPNLYLMSLSAPALLSFGKDVSLIGIHAKQSFQRTGAVHYGDLEIGVSPVNYKPRSRLARFGLYWIQDRKTIAFGEAVVLPIRPQTEPANDTCADQRHQPSGL